MYNMYLGLSFQFSAPLRPSLNLFPKVILHTNSEKRQLNKQQSAITLPPKKNSDQLPWQFYSGKELNQEPKYAGFKDVFPQPAPQQK